MLGENKKNNEFSFDGEEFNVLEDYQIDGSMTSVKIAKSNSSSRVIYFLEEPELSERDKRVLNELREVIPKIIKPPSSLPPLQDRGRYLRERIASYLERNGIELEEESLIRIQYYIVRDFLGFGIIDSVMKDGNVEDISCDGPMIPIYVYHKRYKNIRSNLIFNRREELDNFVVYLAQKGNKQVSISDPIVDTSTPEGNRINVTFGKEVTARGSTFTIRLFRKMPFTPVDLVATGTASPELMAYAWLLTEYGKNIMVLGGTGVGKTSTLNAISLFIPPASKIVSIEDTREINIPHQNWIPAVTRSGVGEGRFRTGKSAGEIDMFDLVVGALRQRPDYMIVGEIRGREAYNLFQAMSMGQTTLTTMHAESLGSMITRLENQPLNIPRSMITALDCIMVQSQLRVGRGMERRITEVSEIARLDPDSNELTIDSVFSLEPSSDRITFLGESKILRDIMELKNTDEEEINSELDRRSDLIRYLAEKGVSDYISIWKHINRYHSDPLGYSSEIRAKMREGRSAGEGRGQE